MATFHALERSNYVRFRPEMLALATAYCAAFDIELCECDGLHALRPTNRMGTGRFGCYTNQVGEELYDLLNAHGLLEEAGLPGADTDIDGEEEIELDLRLVASWVEPVEALVILTEGSAGVEVNTITRAAA